MFGILFVVIIIALVVASLKKGQTQQNRTKQTSYSQQTANRTKQTSYSQQSANRTKQASYQQQSAGRTKQASYPRQSANRTKQASGPQRSSEKNRPSDTDRRTYAQNASIDDELRENMIKNQVTMDEIYDKNNIVAAAKANNLEVAFDNDEDARENLMEGVYEAMVKGPKDTISFQRDFLAEGIDMLNSFQAGNR